MNIAIVGAGRAGSSFAAALDAHHRVTVVHHGDLDENALTTADVVLLCVRDDAIAATSRRLRVSSRTVVAHVAGSRGLDVLAGHARVGSLHPLATLPDALIGARRLRGGVYALEGDELLVELVASLDGRVIRVAPGQRALYHATATAAANHLVALLGHVAVLASATGLDPHDFLALAQQALEDVTRVGPARALTGPASRGDVATLEAHRRAVPLEERATYAVLAQRARRLAREGSLPCSA